jgi:SAM-dependent methyltransferase
MAALPFTDGAFAVALALGLFHCAVSDAEFDAALAETARVLQPGGTLLASLFCRAMLPAEATPEPGQTLCYRLGDQVLCRPDAAQLTARLKAVGLEPVAPPEERPGPPESRRVTLLVTCHRTGT